MVKDLGGIHFPSFKYQKYDHFYPLFLYRPSRLSLEPADMKAENEGMAALLLREKLHVDLTVRFSSSNNLSLLLFDKISLSNDIRKFTK